MFLSATTAIVWLIFVAQIAVVILVAVVVKVSRTTRNSVHHAVLQQAEIEIDSCIDRILMTGGNPGINEIATRARNLLTGPSEGALRRHYDDEYEQTVTKRVEARKR